METHDEKRGWDREAWVKLAEATYKRYVGNRELLEKGVRDREEVDSLLDRGEELRSLIENKPLILHYDESEEEAEKRLLTALLDISPLHIMSFKPPTERGDEEYWLEAELQLHTGRDAYAWIERNTIYVGGERHTLYSVAPFKHVALATALLTHASMMYGILHPEGRELDEDSLDYVVESIKASILHRDYEHLPEWVGRVEEETEEYVGKAVKMFRKGREEEALETLSTPPAVVFDRISVLREHVESLMDRLPTIGFLRVMSPQYIVNDKVMARVVVDMGITVLWDEVYAFEFYVFGNPPHPPEDAGLRRKIMMCVHNVRKQFGRFTNLPSYIYYLYRHSRDPSPT